MYPGAGTPFPPRGLQALAAFYHCGWSVCLGGVCYVVQVVRVCLRF